MVRLLYFAVIVLLLFLSSCETKTIDAKEAANNDSIEKYLDLAANDSLDFDLRNKHNDKAFSFLNLKRNDTLTRFYLGELSVTYIQTGRLKDYEYVAKFHFDKSKEINDTLNIAKYYRYKAGSFNRVMIYDSAFFYYIKAEKLYEKIGDYSTSSQMRIFKAIIQCKIGDYSGSELSLIKAYSFFKNTKKYERIYDVLNQLGLVYNELNDFNKSIFCHKLALETVLKHRLKDSKYKRAVCYNNIGYLYLNKGNYLQAKKNFEFGLSDKNIVYADKELYALLKSNLAYAKFKNNDNTQVLALLSEALKVNGDIIGLPVLTNIYVHLSEYYEEIGDKYSALVYARLALKEAENSKLETSVIVALRQAIIVDRNRSRHYLDKYFKILNDFQSEERRSKARFDKIQFETNEITQEKEAAIKQKWIISVVSGGVVLIIVLLLIITRQRFRQKELQLLQSQQKANEEIYDLMLIQKNKEEKAKQNEKRRIALELHDGVMNKLSSTRLNLDILNHKNDAQTVAKCLPHINEIYQIEREIRNIAHDLSHVTFNNNSGFEILLNDFVATQNNTFTAKYKLEIDENIDWENVSSGIKMNLFRIIQEASHNINKFAHAKNAVISLLRDDNNICLSITDDGQGFDVEKDTDGIGLKNIKIRVESLKGKLVIQSIQGKSTSLNIAIPAV